MRISFLPAHAYLIEICACASHLHLIIPISFWPGRAHLFWPAHAHLILTCACAFHFDLPMRILFLPAHAHLI